MKMYGRETIRYTLCNLYSQVHDRNLSEHVAFVSYRFKPRFVTDEGGFLEFPFKCKTSEKTGLTCRVPLGWLIAQCRSRAMKDYVTHALGCMKMNECMESDFRSHSLELVTVSDTMPI